MACVRTWARCVWFQRTGISDEVYSMLIASALPSWTFSIIFLIEVVFVSILYYSHSSYKVFMRCIRQSANGASECNKLVINFEYCEKNCISTNYSMCPSRLDQWTINQPLLQKTRNSAFYLWVITNGWFFPLQWYCRS